MKNFLILIVTLLFSLHMKGQGNLIPNPSFEFHTSCPNGSAQVPNAVPWQQYESPEYYDTCATDGLFDIPRNFVGSQYARTGEAYCGLITIVPGASFNLNYREFVQVKLIDTLKPNKKYCLKSYVSVADTARYFCSGPGAYFSATAVNPITYVNPQYNINYTAQVESSPLVLMTDSINWTEISLTYLAQGGESYITIGNFETDSNSTWQDTQNGSNLPFAYLYIDDVSLFEEVNATAGNDSEICIGDSIQLGTVLSDSGIIYHWYPSAGLSDTTTTNPWAKPATTTTYYLTIADTNALYCLRNPLDSVTITVNGCDPPLELFVPTVLKGDERLVISALPEGTMLELYDMRGRYAFKEEDYQNDFSAVHLAAGIYSYRLFFPDGTSQKGKICIVR